MVPPDPLSLLNIIGYCQYYWLPLHPDGETLLLKTQHTYAIKHGEMEPTQLDPPRLLNNVHSAAKDSACYQRRKAVISLTQLLTPPGTLAICLHDILV